jgi:hypothetical protein
MARVRAAFDAEEFKAELAKLVNTEDITDVTMPPTSAPTPAPTDVGFKVVEKEVETKAIVAAITFGSLTVAQASHPVMQQSMRSGFAGAMGLAVDHVQIMEVTESKSTTTRRERRLQGDGGGGADVKFKITSPDPTGNAITQLEKDVKEGAAEGAVVAGIIKKAAENKVLTPGLASMGIKVTVATSIVATKTTVTEVVKSTPESASSGLSAGAIAGIAVGAVVLVGAVAFTVTHRSSKKPSTSDLPIGHGHTEGALEKAAQTQKHQRNAGHV